MSHDYSLNEDEREMDLLDFMQHGKPPPNSKNNPIRIKSSSNIVTSPYFNKNKSHSIPPTISNVVKRFKVKGASFEGDTEDDISLQVKGAINELESEEPSQELRKKDSTGKSKNGGKKRYVAQTGSLDI